MKKNFLFIVVMLLVVVADAAVVDTVEIYSNSMHHTIKTVVIRPAAYAKEKSKHFPVIYLLHGAGGSYSNWIKYVPHIQQLADEYQLMIVCPDGASTSYCILKGILTGCCRVMTFCVFNSQRMKKVYTFSSLPSSAAPQNSTRNC